MATTKKISFLCSKCGKTFAGKQSALNHANEYHKNQKLQRICRTADLSKKNDNKKKKESLSFSVLHPQ